MKEFYSENRPELIIIGAGPGDPELITVKAVNILKKASVILYDNLVNRELLNYSSDLCEKIYVGKTPYGNYTPQEEIHELIKTNAYSKGLVVRLKGGDPFVFGRGMEELIYARQNGISASYIPGITSMLAIGLSDIPLTHRGLSEGFWVLTGTKKNGTIADDLKLAMQSNTTVIIYMGMKNLPLITDTYIKNGKGDNPAALIQHASLPHSKTAIGRVKDLEKLALLNNITHPALIVIGEVTQLNTYSKLQEAII